MDRVMLGRLILRAIHFLVEEILKVDLDKQMLSRLQISLVVDLEQILLHYSRVFSQPLISLDKLIPINSSLNKLMGLDRDSNKDLIRLIQLLVRLIKLTNPLEWVIIVDLVFRLIQQDKLIQVVSIHHGVLLNPLANKISNFLAQINNRINRVKLVNHKDSLIQLDQFSNKLGLKHNNQP